MVSLSVISLMKDMIGANCAAILPVMGVGGTDAFVVPAVIICIGLLAILGAVGAPGFLERVVGVKILFGGGGGVIYLQFEGRGGGGKRQEAYVSTEDCGCLTLLVLR